MALRSAKGDESHVRADIQAATGLRPGAEWRNAGVAPCLPGGFPAIALKDAKGGIAALFADEKFDIRNRPPAPPGQAEARGHAATGWARS